MIFLDTILDFSIQEFHQDAKMVEFLNLQMTQKYKDGGIPESPTVIWTFHVARIQKKEKISEET